MVGLQYLSSNTELAYPFKDDALAVVYSGTVVTHGGTATLPSTVFVDALASVDSSITELYLYSVTLSFTNITLVFHDQLGNPVITETFSAFSIPVSNQFAVIVASDATTGNWIKLMIDVDEFFSWLAGVATDTYGTRLQIQPVLVEQQEPRVLSFRLYDDGILLPPTSPVMTDRVMFVPGYNIVMDSTTSDNQEDTVEISLDVQPSAGAGLAPCTAVVPLPEPKKLSVQADSAGNIQFECADQCYNITPVPEASTFVVEGVCTACCTCQDYENVLTALTALFDKARCAYCLLTDAHQGPTAVPVDCTPVKCGLSAPATSKDPFSPVDASYTKGVTQFNSVLVPKYGATDAHIPVMVANGMRGVACTDTGAKRAGCPDYVTFAISIRNDYSQAIEIAPATAPVYTVVDAGTLVAIPVTLKWQAWEYEGTGGQGAPTSAAPDTIDPGKTLQIYGYYRKTDCTAFQPLKFTAQVQLAVAATHVVTWTLNAQAIV